MSIKTHDEKIITDKKGRRIGVILSMKYYKKLLEALEEIESIKIYDKSQRSKEDKIPIEEAFKKIEGEK